MIALAASSCSKKNYSNKAVYQFTSNTGIPDYANLSYWAAHPAKWDPSDSVPAPLRKKMPSKQLADVFFIHPTTFTSKEDSASNASIDDAELNSKTDYSSILFQASVFNEESRVFAPRYRQAHYRNYFISDRQKATTAFGLAYDDVKRAFEYYMKKYNNGRPIIIASHSQGTNHAERLLKEYFDGKPLQQKLVAAYIIGMPIAENSFNNIQPCKDSLSTGCFVAWRTYKKGFEGSASVQAEKFKAVVTNPLTWTIDEKPAPASLNEGAVLLKFNKLIEGVSDAQVHKNILWSSKPKFFGNIFLKTNNYHIADINIFYNNIRQNVKARIAAHMQQ